MNHCIFQEDILFILFTLNIKLHTEGSSNLTSLRLIALKFKSSTRAEELDVFEVHIFYAAVAQTSETAPRIQLHKYPYKRQQLQASFHYIYGGQTDNVSKNPGRKHQENPSLSESDAKNNMETKVLHADQWK